MISLKLNLKQEELMCVREKRILESARILFLKFGFKKTSLDEIVTHAKVGKGAIYEFFGNKEELFKSVVLKGYDELFCSLNKSLALEFDPGKKLVYYVCSRIKYIKESIMTQVTDPEIFAELKSTYCQMFPKNHKEVEILRNILEHGQKNYTFKQGNTGVQAQLISEIIQNFEMSWVEMEIGETEKNISSLFGLILNGLLI